MIEALESRRLLAAVWTIDQPPAAEGYVAGSDPGYNGEFWVRAYAEPGDTAGTIQVPYTLSGTAGSADRGGGTGGVLTIDPATQPYTFVDFPILRDNLVEGDEDVTITLGAGAGYHFGAPAQPNNLYPSELAQIDSTPESSTTVVKDDPPVVSVTAVDDHAAEPDGITPANTGTFRVQRTGRDLTKPLAVDVGVGGTATPPPGADQDYNFSGNVIVGGTSAAPMAASASSGPTRDPIRPPNRSPWPIIAHLTLPAAQQSAGFSEAEVVVTPKSDRIVEGDESVSLNVLASGSTYAVNPMLYAASLTIADNEPTLTSLVAQDYYGQSPQVTAADPGSSTPPPTLYASGPSSDPDHAKVTLVPGILPDTDEAYSQTLFSVTGSDGSKLVDSRAFSRAGTNFDIDWSAVPIGFKYTADAGIDANGDGVLQAGEVTRTLGVGRDDADVVAANAVTIDTSTLPLSPGQWTNQGLIQHSRPPFNNAESFDYQITKVEVIAPTPVGAGTISLGANQKKLTPGGKTRVDWIFTGTPPPAGVSYKFKVTFRSVTSPELSNEVVITVI